VTLSAARARARRSDSELVASACNGDKHAFAELVGHHRATAHRLAQRMLHDPDLAGDAVQEAVVVALVSLPRLRSPDRFGPWLCGITLNVARRWLRELRALRVTSDLAPADDGPRPDEAVAATLLAERVREAIAALAPGQRDAVLLFYLQGLSHREVAAELAISTGAVKARLHQARSALAPRLADEIEEVTAMSHEPVPTTPPRWTTVTVADVRSRDADAIAGPHVVILEDDAERQLPIWIGPPEAIALAVALAAEEMPRPMTYQFTASLLGAAAARVVEARVTRLVEGTFYGLIVIDGLQGRSEIDARPSDALNLALVTGAPIRVDAALLADPEAVDRPGWRDYPTSASRLVADVRRRRQAAQEAITAEGAPATPGPGDDARPCPGARDSD
jgi:RNA polymerase sigma factor (sigma-70 family)